MTDARNAAPRRALALLLCTMLALLLSVTATGCGGASTEPAALSLSGTWTGPSNPGTLNLTLVESHGTVNGAGAFVAGTSTLPVTATGTYSAPVVAVTLSSQGFSPVTLTGTLTSSGIAGTLTGSGFNATPITLTRTR